MVYSHWLGPEPGLGQGPGLVLCITFRIAPVLGRMGCMALIRTFQTVPEQGQRRTLVFITRNIFRTWKIGTRPILQVLKMFPVFFPVPVQVQCKRFLLKPYNPFFLVPVPVPVPDQASVNTPSTFPLDLGLETPSRPDPQPPPGYGPGDPPSQPDPSTSPLVMGLETPPCEQNDRHV